MNILLIFSAFVLLSAGALCRRGNGLRASLVKALLLVFLLIVASTEVLSACSAIALGPLTFVWILANGLAAAALLQALRHAQGLRRFRRKLRFLWRRPTPAARVVVFATVTTLVILLTAYMAHRQLPYDADSVSYHMSRVANWINRASVDFYPTANERQNFYAPGATFAILQLQLLSGSDSFAVTPQYVGMLFCLLLVGMIAQRMRLGAAGAWLAVALTATIPIVISQSHCNQNDLVGTALLLAFTWFLIRFGERPSWIAALWVAAALGMGLVTKGTTFFYGAALGLPFGLHAVFRAARNGHPWTRSVLQLGTAALLALACLTPVLLRCAQDGKTYFKNEYTTETRNAHVDLNVLKANALRNAAMHLALPDAEWNKRIVEYVTAATTDEATFKASTFRERPFKLHPEMSCFFSKNPIHLALAVLAWIALPLLCGRRGGLVWAALAASVLGALFYNLGLRWQYWGIRLQLPWFVLSMLMVSAALVHLRLPGIARSGLQVLIVLLLFIAALPALLMDADLPLWKGQRPPLMFRDADSIRTGSTQARVDGQSEFHKVAAYLQPFDLDEVGLYVPKGNGCWDYNWWVAFGTHAAPGRPKLRHVAPYTWPAPAPAPEWVIQRGRPPKDDLIMGRRYQVVFKAGASRIYRRSRAP